MASASAQSRKALERARSLHHRGDLAGAEAQYRAVLQRDAAAVDALHGLALLCARQGRFEEARQHVDRALGLDAAQPELHFHRAEIVGALGMQEQSLESYRDALARRPDFFEALVNLGGALLQADRPADALAHLDQAVRMRPDDAAALNNRANALQALKRHAEALLGFDHVLALLPGNADVLNNRANALLSLGRFAEAQSAAEEALRIRPQHFHALVNLAKARAAQGALTDALSHYDNALALHESDADAWCDRGAVLAQLQRFREALESYGRALALNADLFSAWNDSGTALLHLGQHLKALDAYKRALSLQPDNAPTHANRGLVLQMLDRHEEAADAYARALAADPKCAYAEGRLAWLKLQLGDWRDEDARAARIIRGVKAGERTAEPFELLFLSDRADEQLACAQVYARDKFPRSPEPLWQGEQYRHDRIRLAYLSGDFREHPTSYLLAGLFERHDRARFELFGFSHGPEDRGQTAARVAAAFEHFVDVRDMSDRDVAALLRRHEIDIAVNLMGYTTFGRTEVYAMRPCPLQVNYLGFPGTLGTDYTDYLIADDFVLPQGKDSDYAERVVRLPDTFQANDASGRPAPHGRTRKDLGLPARGAIFCSFNKSSKITAAMFGVWMAILAAVEGSVLWLQGGGETMQRNLRREARSRGVDGARLVFAPWASYPEHLAKLALADLSFDTTPFNGGATASDALWAGVPVITCPGDAFAARMAGSLLHAVGMPELVTSSLDEYKALAIRLGNDADLLAATKRKLAQNRLTYPLFDTDRFRRNLEAAYEVMWRRYQNGEPPEHFRVDLSASSATSTTR